MSNRLAIDPSEVRIAPYAEIKRRLWSKVPTDAARKDVDPVVKVVDVDFGADEPINPRRAPILAEIERAAEQEAERQRLAEEAERKRHKTETIRDNEKRIDAWIEKYRPSIPAKNRVQMILEKTAEKHAVEVNDIVGPSRLKKIVRARQEAAYTIRAAFPRMSLFAIGKLFSGRDHTTIRWAVEAHAIRYGLPIPESVFSEKHYTKTRKGTKA